MAGEAVADVRGVRGIGLATPLLILRLDVMSTRRLCLFDFAA